MENGLNPGVVYLNGIWSAGWNESWYWLMFQHPKQKSSLNCVNILELEWHLLVYNNLLCLLVYKSSFGDLKVRLKISFKTYTWVIQIVSSTVEQWQNFNNNIADNHIFLFNFFFNSKQLTRRKKAMLPSRKKNTKQPYQDIHWPCILGILISKTCLITLKFAFLSRNENCFSYRDCFCF